jgi:hypothetical protein
MDRRQFVAAAGAAMIAGAGCAPTYTVIRLSVPNPLLGWRRFTLEPMRFDGLQIGRSAEVEWLAHHAPDQTRTYVADRDVMAQEFERELSASSPHVAMMRSPGAADAPVIRPMLSYLEPGYYQHFAHENTEARMVVQVLSPAGQVLDEVQLIDWVQASQYNPTAGERMRIAGINLGRRCAAFLRDRIHGLR